MTNQEILTKAIEKAIAGGWQPSSIHKQSIYHMKQTGWAVEFYSIIFNHDFAKSLFGTELHNGQPRWRNALQYMVVQDNPIEYLGKNI